MNESRLDKWNREFDELGLRRVRDALMFNRYDREKAAAARQWLERADTRAWREASPPDAARGSFILAVKNRMNNKVLALVIGGVLFAIAAARLWRRLF